MAPRKTMVSYVPMAKQTKPPKQSTQSSRRSVVSKGVPKEEPRKRRTAEEARTAILDAAERILVASGPAGIRLQEVAADVGVSHPTVLHHFGSREALVQEVCARRYAGLRNDLVSAIEGSAGGAEQLGAVLDSVYSALSQHGHGRAVFWLALEGLLETGDQRHMRDIALAVHALRERMSGAKRPASLEDSQHLVALCALVLMGQSVMGDKTLHDVGLGPSKAAGARFRSWLARLLSEHIGAPT